MGLQHCQVMRGRRGRGSHTHPDPLQARTCALIDLRGIYWYLSLLRRHLRASGARISITHTFQSVSFVSWWHDVWNATFFFGRLLGVVIREQGEICRRRKLLNRISHRSFVGTHTQKRWHTHRSDGLSGAPNYGSALQSTSPNNYVPISGHHNKLVAWVPACPA